jgi:hypothetical protein
MIDTIHTPAFAADAFEFLAPRIDPRDLGRWSPKKSSPQQLPSRIMERWENDEPVANHLRVPLSPELLLSHLQGSAKLYFKANHTAPEVLIGLDIDAHDGEADAEAVATWAIGEWFPGAYSEGSCRGVHVYLRIDMEGHTAADLRDNTRELNHLFDKARVRHGFNANVDGLKGCPATPVMVRGRWTFPPRTRGTLIKFPMFPCGMADLSRLSESPTFTVDHLRTLRAKLEAEYGQVDRRQPQAVSQFLLKREVTGNSDNRGSGYDCSINLRPHPSYLRSPEETSAQWLARLPPEWLEEFDSKWNSPLPNTRMNVAWTLARGGNPAALHDPFKLVEWYEWLGLATGAHTPARLDRAEKVIAYRTAQPGGFHLDTWLPIIQQHVTPAIREDGRLWGEGKPPAKYSIPDDVLAAMLCLLTGNTLRVNPNPVQQFATADLQIQPFLSTLHTREVISSPLGKKQLRLAGLRMLELSGLITKRELYRKPTRYREGIGTRYNIGPNHPQRAEFIALCSRLEVSPAVTPDSPPTHLK